MTLLDVRGLTHIYPGGVTALDGLDLTVKAGVRLAIVGANGAGKSTLLLHLNGTLKPQGGSIHLDGRAVGYGVGDLGEWRRRVGLVLQDADDQLFAATVAEDVSFGPLNLGLDADQTRVRVRQALDALGIADLADRSTHMLSFGQKKRVAIAGAFAMQPQILLMDEPSAGLDASGMKHLLAAMETLEAAGTTLVFTTHDVDMALDFAHEVAIFDRGKVLAQGAAAAVFGDQALMRAAGLTLPLTLEIALKARERGWLPADAPLPSSRAQLLDWLGRVQL